VPIARSCGSSRWPTAPPEPAGPDDVAVTLEAIRRKVGLVDARVTPLEDAFSASLADGARLLQPVLMLAITAAATVLLALGVLSRAG
jgi:hypothetical protein